MYASRSPGLFTRLLLTPIRLATGWGRPARWLGLLGVVMLVLLRVSVGWHFYTEGLDKWSGDFDAGRFFAGARGPLADTFRQSVWDWEGSIRLDKDRTFKSWAVYREAIKDHFGMDADQRKQVDEAYTRAQKQLAWILESNAAEIEEYELGRERINRLQGDPSRDAVSSLGGQREAIRQEWLQLIAPVLVQIDKVWTNYESEANSVATEEQQRDASYLKLGKPRDVMIDTSVVNPIIPYFDLIIGGCLILGLFTPVAALIAAAFLGSVVASQFPPEAGPTSTYYQMIEAVACLVLAATGAGRFAGLDFLFYALAARLWPSYEDE